MADAVSAEWQSEARGIPMWSGAHTLGGMICVQPHSVVDGKRVYGSASAVYLDDYDGLQEVCEVDVDPFVVDLGHLDTQAAFRRRLAVRLGCPEDLANQGVVVYRRRAWFICAGPLEMDAHEWCKCMGYEDVDNRLLALVRAWCSVK